MKTITCKDNHGKTVKLPLTKFVFRPGAYAVIINSKKEVLLVQNKNGKFWMPGGGIEIGETIEDALKREVKEETGIKNLKIQGLINILESFFYYQEGDKAWHSHMFFYKCKISKKEKMLIGFADEDEKFWIDKLVWLKKKDINKEKFCDLDEEVHIMINKLL